MPLYIHHSVHYTRCEKFRFKISREGEKLVRFKTKQRVNATLAQVVIDLLSKSRVKISFVLTLLIVNREFFDSNRSPN